jgi:hypothetical protein
MSKEKNTKKKKNDSLFQKIWKNSSRPLSSSNLVSSLILVYQIALDPSLVPTLHLHRFQFVLTDLKPNECAN